jgi:predicted nucleotidyltransferase
MPEQILTLVDIAQVIRDWAIIHKNIRRGYIYGSWATGKANANSDIDIALEIDKEPNDTNLDATWIREKSMWCAELRSFLPYKLHLELLDATGGTPRVTCYVRASGILVFQRKDLQPPL